MIRIVKLLMDIRLFTQLAKMVLKGFLCLTLLKKLLVMEMSVRAK